MTIEEDLSRIARQEQALMFDSFHPDTAWELGSRLRRLAVERRLGVVIDITLFSMQLFNTALEGSSGDNPGWVRRKRACVFRFFKSSYAVGLMLKRDNKTLMDSYGLPEAEFAPHGGSFPIALKGTGCIGAVTVSGLPQRDDHNLVVEALASLLDRDIQALRLGEQS